MSTDSWSPPHKIDVSEEELIAELRAAAEALGKPPSTREMRVYGDFTDSVYFRVFGSWNEALKAAKLPVNQPRNACSRLTKRDIEREVHSVAEEVEGAPSTTDFQKHTGLNHRRYQSYWDSWTDMLVDLGYIESVD